MQSNTERLMDKLMAKGISTSANIVDHLQISPTMFKVVCTFSTLKANQATLQHAVAQATNNQLTVVDNSFRQLNKAGLPSAVGFIRASRHVTQPYNEQTLAKFTEIGKNVLMDASDESLWDVEQVGKNKRLVRQAPDNLAELVHLAKVTGSFNVPKLQQIVTASFQRQEYIAFASIRHEEVRHGFILADFEAKDGTFDVVTTSDVEQITSQQVIESAILTDELKTITAGYEPDWNLNAVPNTKKDYVQYYKELYGYDADGTFWKELNNIINQHSIL